MKQIRALGRNYFLFYAITFSGSALTAVSSFFMIERLMGSIEALGVALALKTGFMAIASPFVARVLARQPLAYGFWLSQLLGPLSLIPLFLGLELNQPYLFLFGITIGGLPNLILSLIGITYFRMNSGENISDFKKNQGTLQFVMGISFAIVTLVSPWFLKYFTYQEVLFIDLFTYIFGFFYIFKIKKNISQWDSVIIDSNNPILPVSFPLRYLSLPAFFVGLSIIMTYLLKGLPPMIAGNSHLTMILNLDSISRQSIWFFEASAGIGAGLIYRHFYSKLEKFRIFNLGLINGLFLVFIFLFPNYYALAVVIFLLSTTITLTFMKVRDDFISKHSTKEEALRAAGFVSLVMNFTMTLSPILIGLCTAWYGIIPSVVAVVIVQLIVYFLLYTRKNSPDKKTHLSKKIKNIGSKTITGFLFLICVFISFGLHSYEKDRAEQQMQIWVQNITKSIIPQLIDNDYVPIFSKIELLQKTNLFEDFRVYDSQKELIASISESENEASAEIYFPIKDEAGSIWGYYRFHPNVYYWWTSLSVILPSILFVIIICGWIARILFFRQMNSQFIELESFVNTLESYSKNALNSIEKSKDDLKSYPSKNLTELDRIQIVMENLVNQLHERQKKLFERELIGAREGEIAKISTQVAHDIRSPLMALDSILSTLTQIPEEKRLVVRSSIARIRDIANNLIEKNREFRTVSNQESFLTSSINEPLKIELLSSIIDSLVTEKRMQFRSKIEIEIYTKLDFSSYGIFANIQSIEFKRVLSNLINNSVESFENSGTVIVSLISKNGKAVISVQDNGIGISPDILSKLGVPGVTHGKSDGSGLGLSHARATIEAWKGHIEIDSTLNKGTKVSIYLPIALSPFWFVPQINIMAGSTIIILDDDVSIHQIWKGRFESLFAKNMGISLVHLSTPQEIIEWTKKYNGKNPSYLYLIDYELINYQKNGLMLIEEIGIESQSVLVTSRYEETNVLEECKRLKVKLIPKGLAGLVPIRIKNNLEQPDYILIDDDELIHMSWSIRANTVGKKVLFFYSANEFLEQAENFDKKTPIFIDSNLKNGVKGEEVSKNIFNLGFKTIYLCTGYDPSRFSPMEHIQKVIGKDAFF